MSSLVKNLLIALALAVILWLGYSVFIKEDDTAGTVSVGASSQAALEAQEFLVKLQELNAIKIEGSVFSDTRFNTLIDFRQELRPEAVGRNNPFAPVE